MSDGIAKIAKAFKRIPLTFDSLSWNLSFSVNGSCSALFLFLIQVFSENEKLLIAGSNRQIFGVQDFSKQYWVLKN